LTDLIHSSAPAKSAGDSSAPAPAASSDPNGSHAPQPGGRVRVIREGVASYLPDIDPEETSEWLESFD
jgi:pyruvate dehydrogenase E1 component